jgi:hypothetical protein
MTATPFITIQAGPKNARSDSSGLRYYTWQARELPSVTTVRRMAGLPHNLHQWALSQVINRATGSVWTLVKMLTRKRRPRERVLEKNRATEAGKWLRSAATEERDAAAKLGTTVHDAAAAGIDINLVEEAARPRLRQFRAWLTASRAEILATEFQVFNLAVGYAGTGDLLVRFPEGLLVQATDGTNVYLPPGAIVLIDLKTGKGTYSEHALQLTAYLMAEFSGQDDVIDERITQLLQGVHSIAILHLADDHWEFRIVRPSTSTFRAFRGLLAFAMWMREHDDVDAVTAATARGESSDGEVAA